MAIFPKASLILTAATFFWKIFQRGTVGRRHCIVAILEQGSSNIQCYNFRSQINYERDIAFYLHLHIASEVIIDSIKKLIKYRRDFNLHCPKQ